MFFLELTRRKIVCVIVGKYFFKDSCKLNIEENLTTEDYGQTKETVQSSKIAINAASKILWHSGSYVKDEDYSNKILGPTSLPSMKNGEKLKIDIKKLQN